jgi:hypothetical protein
LREPRMGCAFWQEGRARHGVDTCRRPRD